jgi:hypothetical protein
MSFTTLAPTDFVVSADSVTAPAWSTNIPTLSTFFTASANTINPFYLDVYNADPSSTSAAVQFSIVYGNQFGSGSEPLNPLVPQNTPTRINFGQYRNLIFGDAESNFNFGTGNTASLDLIVIAVDRNRYKESLFPGTFNLLLKSGSSTSTEPIKLTDNSNDVSTITYVDGGRVYNIISGSNGSAANSPLLAGAPAKGYTASGSYGLFLPDIGAIVLNPKALSLPLAAGGIGITWYSGSVNGPLNASASLNSMTLLSAMRSGSSFQLNSQETISSNYIFVRVSNADYNYSTNPSFTNSGSSGEMIYSNFINSPQTFPTTVGMYNNNNELLAVAKMSKPLIKDFTKEALIRVKLDW